MSCKGYRISSSDGDDFDCEYEHAGLISCEDCMYGPYPSQFSMDPETGKRISLKKWEKEILFKPKEDEKPIPDEIMFDWEKIW